MKPLIFKLGIMVFAISFLVGAFQGRPTFSIVFRSFIAFLAFECLMVVVTTIFIKITEELREEVEMEEEEIKEESIVE